MKAYLDTNIISAIEDGEYSLDKIIKIDKSIVQFPYSAAHIQEASNISGTERVLSRLETIREISKYNYLYHEVATRNVITTLADPIDVWETIHEVSIGKLAIGLFTNLFPHDVRNQIIIDLGIDINRINNYTPTEVIDHLNLKIKTFHDVSMMGLIDQAIGLFPDSSNFGLHNKMAGMLELTDMLGYWKDRQTDKSNTARFWDANHCYYATACDYFISDDKRNRYKARVVYEIYNQRTIVISSDGKP
ncbi:hypothetical protein [Mucilaginibacter sp. FT3.2]|uniref:hypothetical protein n=1 Tax=Mucilaginibacter sp. FT3.2 TaxID=2723090 RepID=UPI001612189B|nr:hypothetical protein [Mucilaginibacter sp. FT3.2]MBB6230867.1 hypothetical protein [Mucilaginibacter sp. FT3.2]